MAKNTITLNEAQLQSLVEECVAEVLNEGLWDQMKAGWQGAKRGFQGQKMLDRGTDDFKQNWDREDLNAIGNPWSKGPENTAAMQAREAYQRYKEHQQEANKYLNLYNQLTRKYGLQKTGVGQVKSNETPTLYGSGGILNARNKFGSNVRARNRETNPTGLFGK